METPCTIPGERQHPAFVQIDSPPAVRYKPSRFNAHTTAADGSLVLYNSFTGNTCAIPAASAKKAELYLTQQGLSAPLDKLGAYLHKKGYLVESTVDEDQRMDVRYGMTQFRPDMLELILLASEECNFRCVYCSQSFKRGVMKPEVREGVRNLVKTRIKRLQALRIAWFGGEPLLGYEAIEELAPFFQEIAARCEVPFISDITTNGYLLTPERSLALLRWNVRDFQITLDGTVVDHDAHRPLKEGGATFHQTFNNIMAMKNHDEDFLVTIRVNFDNTNVHRMSPLLDLLKGHVGNDRRFQVRFRPVGAWGGPNDENLDLCSERDITRHFARLQDQARSYGLEPEKVTPYLMPIGKNICFAARPYSFVVGSDGKLMKCTEVLDNEPSNIVGSLQSDGKLALDEDKFGKWIKPYYKEDHTCNKCFFVPVCQGVICSLPRVLGTHRPCPTHKVTIRQTLLEAYKEKLAAGAGTLVQIT